MAAPKTTIWSLDPHTRAKHAILSRYLQAWTPILTLGGFPKVAYVDGFAGPGQYDGGEDGSPISALKTALDHADRIKGKVIFLFVEKERDRADFLEQLVKALSPPTKFEILIEGGRTFEAAFNDFRVRYIDRSGHLPPTFAFIDPFGWTGAPFSIVKEIMFHRSCEVLVTFMYEEINRFIGHPEQDKNFDAFFGTKEWRHAIALPTPRHRNRFLHDLYLSQLQNEAHAKYVRSFEMRNDKDVIDYYLFYATHNLLGLRKMKEAMWRVDELGEFTFSDATDPNQFVLFAREPRFDLLRAQILARFGGREATVGEVEEFVLAATAFRETHYKRQVLRPLEVCKPPRLEVLSAPPGRRRGTYSQNWLRLRFSTG